MLLALELVAFVLVVAASGVVLYHGIGPLRRSPRDRSALAGLEVEPVLVELLHGATIAGLLVDVHPGELVLRNARLPGATVTVPMAGDVVIPRERVAWIQRGITIDDAASSSSPRRLEATG